MHAKSVVYQQQQCFFCAVQAIVVTEGKQCYLVNFRANRVLASAAGALTRYCSQTDRLDWCCALENAACCIQSRAALFA
jgi:hypothetical protein